MTELGDRLDELAGEAMDGIELVHPATTSALARADRPPRHLVVGLALGAIATAVLVAVVLGLGQWDSDLDRVEVATVDDVTGGGEPLPALVRARDAGDVLPDLLLADLDEERRSIDLDEVRAGPVDGDTQVFVAPTTDGAWACVFLVHTGAGDEDWWATSGCQNIEWIRSQGVHVVADDELVGGIAAADVVGLLVDGEPVAVEDGFFLSRVGASIIEEVQPVWEAAVAPVIEVCRRLEPVSSSTRTNGAVGADDAAALVEALRAADGVPAFDDLVGLLETLPPGDLRLGGVSPDSGRIIRQAFEHCTRIGAPGWALVYVSPGERDLPSLPSISEAELDERGRVHEMTESEAEPSIELVASAGIGPITRFGLTDTDLAVFLTTRSSAGQVLHCWVVESPAGGQSSCSPEPFGPVERIDTDGVNGDGEELVLHLWYHDRTASYAKATTEDGDTLVQSVRGRFSAFALPDGGATVSLHDANGIEVDSIVVG